MARAVLLVSLALWTGGLATISFVVAPTAFKVASSRQEAGTLVGAVLRGFNRLELVCGVLALAASLLLLGRRPQGSRQGFVSSALVFTMLTIAACLMFWIYPEAAAARSILQGAPEDIVSKDHFALIHRISVILVSVNIFVGTGLLVCLGLRKTDGG